MPPALGPIWKDQPMPSEAGTPVCIRCGREVRVNRDSYEIFERMHYVCFHYEFEHAGFDPDEECDAGGCPSSSHRAGPLPLAGPSGKPAVPATARLLGAPQQAAPTARGAGE
jgi:hypothetical protein